MSSYSSSLFMRLSLQRRFLTPISTVGEIRINDVHECYTLELPIVDGLPGSAIPAGIYNVTIAPSPKFQLSIDPWVETYASLIPHIMDIPNRSNILIHWGNKVSDTDGCILVGQTYGENFIGSSRAAFGELQRKIVEADTCEIEVMDAVETP